MGILFKNSAALETAHRLEVIILDKTGTLTKGKPEVTDLIVGSKSQVKPGTRNLKPCKRQRRASGASPGSFWNGVRWTSSSATGMVR